MKEIIFFLKKKKLLQITGKASKGIIFRVIQMILSDFR